MIRATALLVACLGTLPVTGCGDDDDPGERPSPALAEKYDVVIAMCEERLQEVTDYCDPIEETTGDVVYANVIFGRAGGHDVTVRTEVTDGGDVVDEPPPDRVPTDRSWLHVVELSRATTCSSPACELVVRAIVDGQEVDRESFSFSG